jgi:hypothetical protein
MAYSPKQRKEIVDSICQKISNGSTLRKALDESTLAYDTFFRWIDEDEKKSKQYTRATELRAEAMAEELLSISDAVGEDVLIGDDGQKIVNHNVIQRDRLRVDSRKWLMSKMFPKKYSEKITNDINIKQEQPLFPDAE